MVVAIQSISDLMVQFQPEHHQLSIGLEYTVILQIMDLLVAVLPRSMDLLQLVVLTHNSLH